MKDLEMKNVSNETQKKFETAIKKLRLSCKESVKKKKKKTRIERIISRNGDLCE